MHKRFAALMLVLLAVLIAVPVMAQEERPTLAELLSSDVDGRFTTLLAAVEATGLTETLNSDGPFTLLAPTNDAIEAGLDFIGMDVSDLVANPDMLREILLYHIVPGSYFFRNLTSSPTLDTALQGTTVSFNLSGNDFTVNGVNIDDVDNLASNGIVHILEDGILLPPGAFPAAHVRVAHFAPDAPEVDVYLNGELGEASAIAFGTVSAWMEVPIGAHSVAVAPTGGSVADAVIGPVNLSFGPGSWTTIAAIGSLENGTLTAQAVVEDVSALQDGQALVTYFHAVEGAPTADVLANGAVAIAELGYPGTLNGGSNDGAFTDSLPAGSYDFQFVATGTSEPALAEALATELAAGMSYLVAAIGPADSPQIIIIATDLSAMMPAATEAPAELDESNVAEEPTEEATPEATPESSGG